VSDALILVLSNFEKLVDSSRKRERSGKHALLRDESVERAD
jgi:hypothetical protein